MTARTWIRNPLAVLAEGDASGGVVVEDGRIVELLPAGGEPATPCDDVVDAAEHVVVPGLINTHHHFHQTLTRAWGPVASGEPFPWLTNLYPVWARLTPRGLEPATTVPPAQLPVPRCPPPGTRPAR